MGGDLHSRDLVILALVFDFILSPEETDDFEGFVEAADTLRAFDAEGGVFLVPVADTHAENEAATAHGVEGGGGLGDVHGVEEGEEEDGRCYLHAFGLRREAGEEGDDGAHLVGMGEVVLSGADHVEADVTGEADLVHGVGDAEGNGLTGRVLGVDEEAEFHFRSFLQPQ